VLAQGAYRKLAAHSIRKEQSFTSDEVIGEVSEML